MGPLAGGVNRLSISADWCREELAGPPHPATFSFCILPPTHPTHPPTHPLASLRQVTVAFREGAGGVPAGGLSGGTWVASARLANAAGWGAWSADATPVPVAAAS